MKDLVKKTRAYALKNALIYGGKAMQGPVISSLFNEGLKKSEVGKYVKEISKIIQEVNSLSLEEQKKEFEKLKKIVSERKVRDGLPDLPNARKGKVIMRFAPSASGALHVGHAATACISFLYVKEYGGKFYVRIEDTNPENIYKPAYKMIANESKWLFDNSAEIIIQSDRMGLYYKYAEKLIKKKVVYVCTCSSEDFREFVSAKKNCPCRKLDVKENLERWKKMLDKTGKGFAEGEAVLRFKSNMKHKNPAMRDFPLARINLTEHVRQKKK
jgi:glutamyl-tRNA synthetase